MKSRWGKLERETQLAILLAVGFVLFRVILASLSGFGFHQGWNEGHYALIADGFLKHPLVPRYGDLYVYNVPPLYPYLVSGSFVLFGESVVSARLPSILATGGLIVATYELGRSVFDDRSIAILGAGILAVLPYVQLFGGRAQTDALMVFFVTASITAIVRGYRRDSEYGRWLLAGGGFFAAAVATKQPAVIVAGVVLLWLVGNRQIGRESVRRTSLLIGVSIVFLLPVVAWFYLNYLTAPAAFVSDWEHELFGRTDAFANVRLLVAIAFGLGMTPPVLAATAVGFVSDIGDVVSRYRRGVTVNSGPSILTWWLVLFGAFVFARTPSGHQYYAVVLAPPIALLAAHGIRETATLLEAAKGYRQETIRFALVVLVVCSSVAGSVVLFELSGEFSAENGGGTQVAADTSQFVETEVPDDATVLVSNGYAPPVKWYVRNEFPVEQVNAYHVSTLDKDRLQNAVRDSEGPVYLVYPSPSWSELPETKLTPVHESTRYRYTVLGTVGSHVHTDSKFTFYLNDRRLVSYRVDEAAFATNESVDFVGKGRLSKFS